MAPWRRCVSALPPWRSTSPRGANPQTALYTDVDSETGLLKDTTPKPSNPHTGCSSTNCRMLTPIAVLLTLCLVIVLGFAVLSVILKLRLDQARDTCLSPDCAMTAGTMLGRMGLTAPDPSALTSFLFQYACAEYNKDEHRPPDKAEWNAFSETRQRVSSLIRVLLASNGLSYLSTYLPTYLPTYY